MAGVPVEVAVRGVCALVPGMDDLSENIRVRSVLGRYLEHSRIFAFHNNGDPQIYIGSADMMHRNLDRRIEALIRLTDPSHLDQIDRLFETIMSDTTASWHLQPTGDWLRVHQDGKGEPLADLQNVVMTAIASRRRSGSPRS
jgi:polyphosphate kinase